MSVGIGVSIAKLPALAKNTEFAVYNARVAADSGTIDDNGRLLQYINFLKAQGRYDLAKFVFAPMFGGKLRTSGIYKYQSKLYSVQLAANDAAQTTELSQPYQVGNIAPNETNALYNGNGESRFMTHPEISFAANEAWSMFLILNNNGTSAANNIIYSDTGGNTTLYVKLTTNIFAFKNASGTTVAGAVSNAAHIGKNTIYHFVAAGDGTLKIYANGTIFDTITVATDAVFDTLSQIGANHIRLVQAGAMTAQQVSDESALFRGWIEHIEQVQIDSQIWSTSNLQAVTTPAGQVIPEVQSAATWTTATDLYNAAGGSERDKLIAAAMWCNYNNNAALGAVYGKILNGYAIKLLELDYATAAYGWRITQDADWNSLTPDSSDNVLKKDGSVYWVAGNEGTNASGLTLLPNGMRTADGVFTGLNYGSSNWNSDDDATDLRIGAGVRLIKL